jgi:bacteriophage protein of unknown function (DUF646)
MASQGFDTSELARLARRMGQVGEGLRRQVKPFLRKEGTKLKTRTAREARKVGKKTGNYIKSIKRGKAYTYRGSQAIRVYSYAPHAHLIEEGHRMVTHDGREVGFVQGHHVFEAAARDFGPRFVSDLDDFLDEAVRNL